LKNGTFTWHVVVPANTRANVLIPAKSVDDITENGKPVMQMEEVKYIGQEKHRVNLEIGSGSYTFVCKYDQVYN
ncbi:MAG TPA: alpha-L-rhamnosidase C-terminal domain-containing protein, partial [Bacteroidales bacterium]